MFGLEIVNAACKQACAKDNKECSKHFLERDLGMVEEHEIGCSIPDALVGQLAQDEGERGALVLTCGEASGNSGETGGLTGLDVAEQSVLLNIHGEICKKDIAHVLCVAVSRVETPENDESSRLVEEKNAVTTEEATS